MKNQELIRQGAEGKVYLAEFLGKRVVVKQRFSKKYRHPVLDESITKSRIREETRCISRAFNADVDVPTIYHVDIERSEIVMEHIDGWTLKEIINNQSEKDISEILEQIGTSIAKLHDTNIIHGDLTTSNMMIRKQTQSVVIIDFGLGYTSTLAEDRAVDLYVLERAFQSTHPTEDDMFIRILNVYSKQSKRGPETMKKLETVRQRGRKRDMIG